MTTSTAYKVGRTLGRLPLAAKLLLIAAISASVWWLVTEPERRLREETERAKAMAAAAVERTRAAKAKLKEECSVKRQTQLVEFQRLLTTDPREAADLIKPCASVLEDAELISAVKTAQIALHNRAISHQSASTRERIALIDEFAKQYPTEAKQYESLRARLDALAKMEEDQRARKAQQRELARRKSEGVSIGMTQEEVIQSNWGRPEHVNRTVHSFGTHEQWVYGGGNYLYFEGGRLTSMQTGGRR